jgi:lysophospholipid acyltransferase (LPLAT)-like uncharacterized protein
MAKKRALKKRIGDWMMLHVAVPILYVAARLIWATQRHRHLGDYETYLQKNAEQERFVVAFWHGDIFYMAPLMMRHRHEGAFHIMASRSRDGALAAKFISMCGAHMIRGSSSRGGGRALLEMLHSLAPGDHLALALDGPRGPRHRVTNLGAIHLASRSGLPILPMAARTPSKWQLRSWDRMEIPKPFAKIEAVYGELIYVPADADKETLHAKRLELEEKMVAMKNEAGAMEALHEEREVGA